MIRSKINSEKTFLGIEFGSTRIKACLIDDKYEPIASGSHQWENRFENNLWTYSLQDIKSGLQDCYMNLCADVWEKYQVKLHKFGAMGISGMMHGYMPFDKDNNLLVPFRTWRNINAAEGAEKLSELFRFNVPARWSVAHFYQAILNGEEHIKNVNTITTLAGYIHFILTGKNEVGIGEASGIFPVENGVYNKMMIEKFDSLNVFLKSIMDILPTIKVAGDKGAYLTKSGAEFLDPSGNLEDGIPVCPPEGDAGTGMVATNSVKPGTGNISAGTSAFSMIVLKKHLKTYYPEIDVVLTPDGYPVAMVHCNNCCGEIDSWISLFDDVLKLFGKEVSKDELYSKLYENTLSAKKDCNGIISYNFIASEPVSGVKSGKPLCFRNSENHLSLPEFIKSQLYSTFASLKLGMDILFDKENVEISSITAHGGLFKVKNIAQQCLSDALGVPVSVMQTAGEGGAWGIALLSAYMIDNKGKNLSDWLNDEVFNSMETSTLVPDKAGVEGFKKYIGLYKEGLKMYGLSKEEQNA